MKLEISILATIASAHVARADCALTEAKLALGKDNQADEPIVGDFNGDGKLDVAFSEMKGRTDTRFKPSGDVRVFLGNGDGTFGKPIITDIPVDEAWSPHGVAGDFDGDGKIDIALLDAQYPSHDDQIYVVLLGKGNGHFGKPVVGSRVGFAGFYNVRAVDIDGDKKTDIVASVNIDDKGAAIAVLNGKAGGKLGKPMPFVSTHKDLSFELAYRDKFVWQLADIDGDGTQELVVAPNAIAAVDFDRSSGAGNYGVCAVKLTKKLKIEKPQCTKSTRDFPAETVALADFNGDGQLDVASGPEQHSYMDSTSHLDVVLNAGKGMLEKDRRPIKADTSALNTFWALDAGDVTGDGKADIIAIGSKSGGSDTIALVLPGKGDGTFPSAFVATTNYQANANAADVAFGAFQGKGTLGFVIYAWEGPESFMHVYSGRCKE